MSRSKRERPQRPLCEHVHPDDGVDPRTYFSPKKTERKHSAERLCRAAERVVGFALSFELEDPILQGLVVIGAQLARDGVAVEVGIQIPSDLKPEDREVIATRLLAASPLMRRELARSLQRRRVPSLLFRLTSESEDAP